MRRWNRRSCSSFPTENQYLINTIPARTSMPLEFRAGPQKLLVLLFRAIAHDPFHTGPVVPTSIQNHHFPRGGQMGHIALKIPLCSFTFGRCRQGNHSADSRIHALGNAFDRPPFAGRVATLEDDHHFHLLMHDPLLELHQFNVEFGEPSFILATTDPFTRDDLIEAAQFGGQHVVGRALLFLVFLFLTHAWLLRTNVSPWRPMDRRDQGRESPPDVSRHVIV